MLTCGECGKPVPSGHTRHPECFEDSLKASRSGVNGPIRYSLLGLSQDILEVLALARAGGAGPVGPGFERMYWNEGERQWTLAKPTQEPEAVSTTTNPVEKGAAGLS